MARKKTETDDGFANPAKNGITSTPPLLASDPAAIRQDAQAFSVAAADLKKIVGDINDNQSKMDKLSAAQREIYALAKDKGFKKRLIKQVIKLQNVPEEERSQEAEELDLYLEAMDLLPVRHRADEE